MNSIEAWQDAFAELASLVRRNPDAKLLLWPIFELGQALARVEDTCEDAEGMERMRLSSHEIIREARFILSRE